MWMFDVWGWRLKNNKKSLLVLTPVVVVVSAGFTLSCRIRGASLPQVCVCLCVCVCQLEWSWRTGVPLPRQHFLVINDFFLPPYLSLSLPFLLSLCLSSSRWWKLMTCEHLLFQSHEDRGSSGRGGKLEREHEGVGLCRGASKKKL